MRPVQARAVRDLPLERNAAILARFVEALIARVAAVEAAVPARKVVPGAGVDPFGLAARGRLPLGLGGQSLALPFAVQLRAEPGEPAGRGFLVSSAAAPAAVVEPVLVLAVEADRRAAGPPR